MNTIQTPKNILRIIVGLPIIIFFILSFSYYYLTIYIADTQLKDELYSYENELLNEQKKKLEIHVNNLKNYITYYTNEKINIRKKDAQKTTQLIYQIAQNIYNKNKDDVTESELKKMILNSFKNINLKSNLGSVFILDFNNTILLHEQTSLLNKKVDSIDNNNALPLVKTFRELLIEKNEGFVDYNWYMPFEKSQQIFCKINFVKDLNFFNWYIGIGIYPKYSNHFIKNDLQSYIKKNIRFQNGFYVISNSKNTILEAPHETNQTNLLNFRTDGLYLANTHMTYTDYIPQLDWYITGVYTLDVLQEKIDLLKEMKKNEKIHNQHNNLFIFIIFWSIVFIFSLYLLYVIKRLLSKYTKQIDKKNKQLIFQSRMASMGSMLDAIAHQWRQPLMNISAIMMNLDIGIEQNKNKKELKQKVLEVFSHTIHMSNTIEDFRSLLKFEKEKTQFLVADVLKSVFYLLKNNIKDINITTDFDNNLSLQGYKNELIQVYIIIISNSIETLTIRDIKNKQISIKIIEKNKNLIINLKDNAGGIDKKIINQIFDPYFTTKENKGGSGLGLYIAYLIIKQTMHGTIEVSNCTDGVNFTITIPTS